VVDVGCGFGATAIVLARAFPHSQVVGIDLSESLLHLAAGEAHDGDLGEWVTFEKADAQQIPFDDNSFDVVVNVQMLHIVEEPVAMLDEMMRVLGPAGMLLLADIRRSWAGWLDKVFRTALTVDEARELIRRSKLREGTFISDLLWWCYEA
jgi:ubiquinone/menaquinone biosynthesis C-methylase UbiE